MFFKHNHKVIKKTYFLYIIQVKYVIPLLAKKKKIS